MPYVCQFALPPQVQRLEKAKMNQIAKPVVVQPNAGAVANAKPSQKAKATFIAAKVEGDISGDSKDDGGFASSNKRGRSDRKDQANVKVVAAAPSSKQQIVNSGAKKNKKLGDHANSDKKQ